MQFHQIGRSNEAEFKVFKPLCGLQSAGFECHRKIEFGKLLVGLPDERQNTTLSAGISPALCDAFGLAQALEYFMVLVQLNQHCPQIETNVDGFSKCRLVLRQSLQGVEGLIERDPSIVERRASHRLDPRLPQVVDRLIPHVASDRVMGKPLDLLAEAVMVEPLDRLDNARVERAPALLEQTAVCDLVGQRVPEGVLEVRK